MWCKCRASGLARAPTPPSARGSALQQFPYSLGNTQMTESGQSCVVYSMVRGSVHDRIR